MLSHIRSQWRRLRGPAPWWAHAIIRNQGIIMSKLDDLNGAVSDLGAAATDAANTIESQITALSAAHADDDTDAVEAAVAKIKEATATLRSAGQTASTVTAPTGAGPDDAPVAVTSTDTSGSAAVAGDASALAPAAPSGIAAPSPFGV